MPSSWAPASKKNKCLAVTNSRTISAERQVTPPGSIYVCLSDDSKEHFGFAVYEISELEHTMSSPCFRHLLCGASNRGYPTNFLQVREICVTYLPRCKGIDMFNPRLRNPAVQFAR